MTAALATTERQLQDAVLHCARLFGWRCYHSWSSIHSEPGFPDLVCVRIDDDGAGRVLAIELKAAGKHPTPEQNAWLDELAAAGVECYVWTPLEWQAGEVEAVVR